MHTHTHIHTHTHSLIPPHTLPTPSPPRPPPTHTQILSKDLWPGPQRQPWGLPLSVQDVPHPSQYGRVRYQSAGGLTARGKRGWCSEGSHGSSHCHWYCKGVCVCVYDVMGNSSHTMWMWAMTSYMMLWGFSWLITLSLTLGAHTQEGYGTCLVCVCVLQRQQRSFLRSKWGT